MFIKTNSNGITLIALIITIIILFILAGVSISLVTGDNGVLTQTSTSKVKTDIEAIKERIGLEDSAYQMSIAAKDNLVQTPDYDSIISASSEFSSYTDVLSITPNGTLTYIGEYDTETARIAQECGVDFFLKNVKNLYDLANSFKAANSSVTASADELCLQFIRKANYDNSQWDVFAGDINEDFITYVVNATSNRLTPTYFQTATITNIDVDFDHLCANLNAIIYNDYAPLVVIPFIGTVLSDDFTGWAGDLATLMGEVAAYDSRNRWTDFQMIH